MWCGFVGYWFLDLCCRLAWCTATLLLGRRTTSLPRCWSLRAEMAFMGESVTGGLWASLSSRCLLVSIYTFVFLKIPLNNIILFLRCTGMIEPSSKWFHGLCNCDQVTHRSMPTLWWEPTVRSWTIKTPSTSPTTWRSPKMPKTSSVPSSPTGRKRELLIA